MEQAELRAWEHKCIQEEVPQCTAACPLHVDVRTFCKLMRQQRWDKAWAVLTKTMPLPDILARICDGPCRQACIREKVGGPILIDSLEHFCANTAKATPPPRPLPKKNATVAVVGENLPALASAWELARKGFTVHLHSVAFGKLLHALPEAQLPSDIIERQKDNLTALGVILHEEETYTSERITTLLEEHTAVFAENENLPKNFLHTEKPDAITLGVSRNGLFSNLGNEPSPAFQAAAGRRAANSIERYFQGVSLVTDRAHEGAYPTRLSTNIRSAEHIAPIPPNSEGTAKEEAARCLQCDCMECVQHCEYLAHYKAYPKVYVRQIYNNESIVMGTRQANTMINSCMLCGLCETLCPEDFSMSEVCLEARRSMVRREKMPPSAHEFALRDMAFANSTLCTISRHAPNSAESNYVFFPGCQLAATSPDHITAAYKDLCVRLGDVGLMLRCCGAPAEWSGRESLMQKTIQQLREQWQDLGSPTIIASCPTCIQTLRAYLPEAEITPYWTVLRTLGLPEGHHKQKELRLAISDPCNARHDETLQQDVRFVLHQLSVDIVEPEMTGSHTECCGYGGLLAEANPQLGNAVAKRRGESVEEDFITYCAMCREMFAKNGKHALQVYDLLFPDAGHNAQFPPTGYSDRRENRIKLQESLLKTLWKEQQPHSREPYEGIVITPTPEAVLAMEERRILTTDIQKVLYHAKTSGSFFVHSETGHFLASYRPVLVTYWVEFTQKDTQYLIHNVWSHRMHIKGLE